MLHASCIQWPSYIVLSLSRRSVTIKNNHLFSVTGGIFSKKDSSLRTEILTSLWFMSNQSGLSFKWTHCSLEDHLTLTFSKLLLKHKINKKASTKNKRQHLSCGLSFDSLNDYTKRPFFLKFVRTRNDNNYCASSLASHIIWFHSAGTPVWIWYFWALRDCAACLAFIPKPDFTTVVGQILKKKKRKLRSVLWDLFVQKTHF